MDRADAAGVTLHVCTTCRSADPAAEASTRPGERLHAALAARFGAASGVTVVPVECLSVCKRAATIALAGPGRWTYVIGDLDPERQLEDVVAGTLAYRAAADGIVPWRERPQCFRKGVVARIPPAPPAAAGRAPANATSEAAE